MAPTQLDSPRLISLKVEPRSEADAMALPEALAYLMREDASLSFTVDPESGETILHGVSELHLDLAIEKLHARGVAVNAGPPVVAYLETLAATAEVEHVHKRQGGGSRQFARVTLRLEPSASGNAFAAVDFGDALPDAFVAAVEKGVRSVWANGVLIGFPMSYMRVTLLDATTGEDSSALAFEVAARAALKEGCEKAGVKLLEPIMDVEVVTPGDCVGRVIGDLNASRAVIIARDACDGESTVIRAEVPLASLFGYVSRLRSQTEGRGSHRMTFNRYQEVPRNVVPDPDTFPPAVGMRA